MAIKNTDDVSVAKLFEDNKSKTQFFSIPKYQREYTWGKDEWMALFNDVIENGKDYFLGSIISVSDDGLSEDYPTLEIIDGQQRMTTLSILLAVIYKKAAKFKKDLNESKSHTLFSVKLQLVYGKEIDCQEVIEPRLIPQMDNKKDYDYVLFLCGLLEDIEMPKNFGNRRIAKAYKFFDEQIELFKQEKVSETFDECSYLFDLINKFNSACLVHIEVSNNRDAYMLFESLNHRGVPLSAIDLIKNSLIRVSSVEKKDAECYNRWKVMLSKLTDEYVIQERFFRQFYNAFRDDLNKPFAHLITNAKTKYFLGPLATRTSLLDIYEQLIKRDYEKILNELKDKAEKYSVLINNSKNCPEILKKPLIDLERIQGAPSYILLLFILSKQEELDVDNEMVKRIVEDLIKFFVRRNVTDFPNTRNLNSIFMEVVDLISMQKGTAVFNEIHKKLVEKSSTDELFESKLNGKLYEENVDAVRFLLSRYEEQFFTKENERNLWERNEQNKFIFTIEHIFPEGENIPDYWVEMIADGDVARATLCYEKYVHTLGNLTLTAFNSNLSNKAFDEKKKLTDKNGNYIGYKNGLKLNEDVVSEGQWTEEKIKNRTNKFVNFFKNEYSFSPVK